MTNNRVRKMVELDRELVKWFNSHYPRGNYSWVFNLLLDEFRKAHKETPRDYAATGAAELKKLIDGGVSSVRDEAKSGND